MTADVKTQSEAASTRWIDIAKIAAPLVVSVLTFSLGGGFTWKEFLDTPDLVYAVLPAYEIADQTLGGLVVENRGRVTAHDVLVKVFDLDGPIEALQLKSDENADLQGGGSGKQEVTVWLDRLAPTSSLTMYMMAGEPISLEGHISVIAEEGRGTSVSKGEPGSGLLIPVTVVIAVLVPAGFGISLFFLNYSARKEIDRARQRLELDREREADRIEALEARERVELDARRELFQRVVALAEDSDLDEESKKEFIRQAFEYAASRSTTDSEKHVGEI